MHHSADVTAATSSVQGVSVHSAPDLQACLLTMHTVQAFVVHDYLD
jgi:hypothetical protein